jgi:hypothetical protein
MIQDIVTEINDQLDACLQVDDSVYYNIARVVNVNGEVYPTTGVDGKATKICLNDKLNIQVYHKVSSFDFSENKDLSFGKRSTYIMSARSKMIVVMKSALHEVNPNYTPENFLLLMPHSIPLDGYQSIKIQKVSVTTDHDTIVNREWKKIDYSKHKCKFLVFEVNYNIRAITCKLECGSFLLLEDDYKLLQENGSAILL